MRHGRTDDAETELLAGLKLDPAASGLSINLADLYRQTGREAAGEQALLAALSISPQAASLRHALGLTLVRQKRIPQAMDQLARAVALDPANARFGYVYGVALQSTGRGGEALAVWRKVLEAHPWDASTLSALMSDALARRDRAQASKLANRLSALSPDDAELARQAARLARP
jgi:Flp pilus assembly protein TadD